MQRLQKNFRVPGDRCFLCVLFAILIMLGFLFIVAFPKIVLGLEHISHCPLAPMIPVYMCVSGIVDVICPVYSIFIWFCVLDNKIKRPDHPAWYLVWFLLGLIVPVSQLVGGPYIIYVYKNAENYTLPCDVKENITPAVTSRMIEIFTTSNSLPSQKGQYNQSDELYKFGDPQPEGSDVTDDVIRQGVTSCRYCNDTVMTSAVITVLMEFACVTVPFLCLALAFVIFRIPNSDKECCC